MLVTGAARGIGAEAARQLARRGARVALVGLEAEELERVAGECGADAVWFEADVTDREAVEAAVGGTVERGPSGKADYPAVSRRLQAWIQDRSAKSGAATT